GSHRRRKTALLFYSALGGCETHTSASKKETVDREMAAPADCDRRDHGFSRHAVHCSGLRWITIGFGYFKKPVIIRWTFFDGVPCQLLHKLFSANQILLDQELGQGVGHRQTGGK